MVLLSQQCRWFLARLVRLPHWAVPHIVPQANGSGRVSRSGSSAFANSITFFFIKAFSSYSLVTESIDCVYLILDVPKTNGLRQVEAVLGGGVVW